MYISVDIARYKNETHHIWPLLDSAGALWFLGELQVEEHTRTGHCCSPYLHPTSWGRQREQIIYSPKVISATVIHNLRPKAVG